MSSVSTPFMVKNTDGFLLPHVDLVDCPKKNVPPSHAFGLNALVNEATQVKTLYIVMLYIWREPSVTHLYIYAFTRCVCSFNYHPLECSQ